MERLQSAKYRVTTVVPLVNEPTLNIRILDQDGLEELLNGYNEYAEFMVSVERIEPDTPGSGEKH